MLVARKVALVEICRIQAVPVNRNAKARTELDKAIKMATKTAELKRYKRRRRVIR